MYQSKYKGKKIDSAVDKVAILEENLNQTISKVQNIENGVADNKSRINEIEISKGQPNGFASLNSEGKVFLDQLPEMPITPIITTPVCDSEGNTIQDSEGRDIVGQVNLLDMLINLSKEVEKLKSK